MNTDMKWAMIAMICVIGLPLSGLALSEYHQSQCRIEAIRAQMSAEDILKLCGK